MGAMEHRCGERLPVDLPATMHVAGGREVAVTIRNLSSGGAFLVLDGPQAVIRGLVELEFHVPGGDAQDHLWRAWVLRQQGDGVALMFDDLHRAPRLPVIAGRRSGPPRQAPPPAGSPAAAARPGRPAGMEQAGRREPAP